MQITDYGLQAAEPEESEAWLAASLPELAARNPYSAIRILQSRTLANLRIQNTDYGLQAAEAAPTEPFCNRCNRHPPFTPLRMQSPLQEYKLSEC